MLSLLAALGDLDRLNLLLDALLEAGRWDDLLPLLPWLTPGRSGAGKSIGERSSGSPVLNLGPGRRGEVYRARRRKWVEPRGTERIDRRAEEISRRGTPTGRSRAGEAATTPPCAVPAKPSTSALPRRRVSRRTAIDSPSPQSTGGYEVTHVELEDPA